MDTGRLIERTQRLQTLVAYVAFGKSASGEVLATDETFVEANEVLHELRTILTALRSAKP